MLKLICDCAQPLKEFTDNNYAQASFFWSQLIKNKEIKVNGKKVGADILLNVGDEICYYLTKKQEEKLAYYTVYEDENFLIADKESGVNAEAVFADISRKSGGVYAFIHRLDRNTRGVMAFAKNAYTEEKLLLAFKEKQVEKVYLARCFGEFLSADGVLTAYLKKDEKNALVKIYDTPVKDSEKIITEYKNAQRKSDGTWIVEVILHTGKTHQIRAHLAHIGAPIVGDMKYGDTQKNKALNTTRQCLIAKTLRFCLDGELSYLHDKTFVSQFAI